MIADRIVISEVQQGLFAAKIRGTTKTLNEAYLTPLRSFTSRKSARDFINSNWEWLRQYN